MKKTHPKIIYFISFLLLNLCLTSCGAQELSFGKEIFFGVKAAEEISFAGENHRPVQVAAGSRRLWALAADMGGGIYERELSTGTARSLQWKQGEQEMIMGISAAGDMLYAAVSCGETVQVRKCPEGGSWETLLSIPREEAPEQVQPTVFFADTGENAWFANEDEIWKYSPENGRKTIYKVKGSIAFLLEKTPGTVAAVAKSGRKITLYSLTADGKVKEQWTIPLPTIHLASIMTEDTDTLVLAVDNRILFLNNETGEIVSHFNSIDAGVSTNLLGGLWHPEEGAVYLVEQAGDTGGIWEELAAQNGPEGERTVLVYGTVSLSETMRERITSFNRSNPDYYITVKEYDGKSISDQRLQMQAAVTSGRGPDILDLYSRCVDNYTAYAEKGYLEDLEPWLLEEELNDDMVRAIHELYRVEGKLCMAVPHFTLWGFAVNPEYLPETESWDYQTFTEAAGLALPANRDGTAGSLLGMLLRGRQNEFINRKEKTASFDTPEFISLLEFCRDYGDKSLVKFSFEDAPDAMMVQLSAHDPGSYLTVHACYGEKAVLYGYPATGSQVLLVNNAVDACGIYSQSRNKEGALEFLRTLFAEDYQGHMSSYTSAWAARESCWYAQWDSSQSGIHINGIYAAPAAEGEAERLADLILSGNVTADLVHYTVIDLVLEETNAYFTGDRTAEETARNIQSRIQLMLEE